MMVVVVVVVVAMGGGGPFYHTSRMSMHCWARLHNEFVFPFIMELIKYCQVQVHAFNGLQKWSW